METMTKVSESINTTIAVGTFLPVFPGFYYTGFDFDDENSEIDYINEIREENHLKPINDYDVCKFDYATYRKDVAIECCKCIEYELKRAGFIQEIKFENIYSPREYNFSNDSINVSVILNQNNIKNIKLFLFENVSLFEDYIKDQFTSYSGFISHYNNDYITWLNDINNCLNHKTQLGVILDFICQVSEIKINDLCEAINDVSIELKNYDDLTEKEYCNVCKQFVHPSDYDGNCCNDCKETGINNLDIIICKCCGNEIYNVHEKRHFIYQIKHNIINYSEIICSDCLNK